MPKSIREAGISRYYGRKQNSGSFDRIEPNCFDDYDDFITSCRTLPLK